MKQGKQFMAEPFCVSDGDEAKAAGETPSWAQVHEMANLFRPNGGSSFNCRERVGMVAQEKRVFSQHPFTSMLRRWMPS